MKISSICPAPEGVWLLFFSSQTQQFAQYRPVAFALIGDEVVPLALVSGRPAPPQTVDGMVYVGCYYEEEIKDAKAEAVVLFEQRKK